MAFSNPIVGGDDTLIRDKIQSEGFVSGATGWSIERDGDAEFNDLSIRGTVHIQGTDDPDSAIDLNVDVTGQPYQQFTDSEGRVYRIQTVNATLDVLRIRAINSPNSGLYFVDGEGIALRSDSVGAPSVLFDDDDGYLKWGQIATNWIEQGWINIPALQNSWVADTSTPQYRVQPDGTVRFRGWIKNGTTGLVTTLFTMPADARPSSDVYFKVAKPNDAGATGPTIDVTTAGVVRLIHIGTSVTASLSLDNISYSIL